MKRRSFLKGLIAAPAIITIPGLLMPVKALPVPWALVTCVRADGTELIQPIWDPIAPVDIYALPFMGHHPLTATDASYRNPVVNVRGIEYPGRPPWGKPLSDFSPKGPDIHWEMKPAPERVKKFLAIDEFKAFETFAYGEIDKLKVTEAEKDAIARNTEKREKVTREMFDQWKADADADKTVYLKPIK